jgi:hypothetical protein
MQNTEAGLEAFIVHSCWQQVPHVHAGDESKVMWMVHTLSLPVLLEWLWYIDESGLVHALCRMRMRSCRRLRSLFLGFPVPNLRSDTRRGCLAFEASRWHAHIFRVPIGTEANQSDLDAGMP